MQVQSEYEQGQEKWEDKFWRALFTFSTKAQTLLIFQYRYHLFYYPATKVHNWSDETMTSKCKYLGNQESFKINS